MDEFDELISELANESRSSMGCEAAEELDSDLDFLLETFKEQIMEITFKSMILGCVGDNPITNSITDIVAGMQTYRDWLIERGVDVRALEGR